MSILYKDPENWKYTVSVKTEDDNITLTFYVDGGKHGTEECIDEYSMTVKELLKKLQSKDE